MQGDQYNSPVKSQSFLASSMPPTQCSLVGSSQHLKLDCYLWCSLCPFEIVHILVAPNSSSAGNSIEFLLLSIQYMKLA